LAKKIATVAEHKHMTVNSCLEEMLLHTNDGVGPHIQTTLRHIQELKKTHGIDYGFVGMTAALVPLDHRPAFFLACLIPARNACDTILA
jgi:hypothetical protein